MGCQGGEVDEMSHLEAAKTIDFAAGVFKGNSRGLEDC